MKTMNRFSFEAESDYQKPVSSKSQQILKLKAVLKQCKTIIIDLQQSNISMDKQLTQKNIIIDKLIQQKQDHILHLSMCNGDSLKKELDRSSKKMEDANQQYLKIINQYDEVVRKNREQIKKLKNYNKVLRLQNGNLRQEMSEAKKISIKDKKIGSISCSLKKSQKNSELPFQLTKNGDKCVEYINGKDIFSNSIEVLTPQKQFTTSRSTNYTFSNHKGSGQLNRQSQNKYIFPTIPKNLFQNDLLKQSAHISQKQNTTPQQKFKRVQSWIQKLKDILADSDQQ